MPHQIREDDITDALQKLSKKLEQLEQDHQSSVAAYNSWKETIDQQTREEQRRIAPGYLDTADRILVPHRLEEPADTEMEVEPTEEETVEEPVNELDKAFGKVNID